MLLVGSGRHGVRVVAPAQCDLHSGRRPPMLQLLSIGVGGADLASRFWAAHCGRYRYRRSLDPEDPIPAPQHRSTSPIPCVARSFRRAWRPSRLDDPFELSLLIIKRCRALESAVVPARPSLSVRERPPVKMEVMHAGHFYMVVLEGYLNLRSARGVPR